MGVAQAEPVFHTFGEEGKATRHQQGFHPMSMSRRNQAVRAQIGLQALFIDTSQITDGYTFQKRDTTIQAFGEILDFTAHGRFGNRGNLFLATSHIGNLVNTLDIDQRGIHVHCQHAHFFQAINLLQKGKVHRAGLAQSLHLSALRVVSTQQAYSGGTQFLHSIGLHHCRNFFDDGAIQARPLKNEMRHQIVHKARKYSTATVPKDDYCSLPQPRHGPACKRQCQFSA